MVLATQKLSEEVKAEYISSLADLTFKSQPLINMLTMLAEENITYAREIVEVIERHLLKVAPDVKLPVLYLIDCIVKTVGNTYTTLFSQSIVFTICNVFRVVDEKTRKEILKLRQTWNAVFPQNKLYAIDAQISMLDPAWPVIAKPPLDCIHFNPKSFKNTTTTGTNMLPDIKPIMPPICPVSATSITLETITMQQQVIMKQKELLELQQKKLVLELLENQIKFQEQWQGKLYNVPGQQLPQGTPTMLQKLHQTTANVAGPKISPVNCAVEVASKAIRDPRLLRKQQQQLPQDPQNHHSITSKTQIESKNAIIDLSNQVVNSKLGVRETDSTHTHLVNNKESVPSLNKIVIQKPKSSISLSHKPYKPCSFETACMSSSMKSSSSSTSTLDSLSKSKTSKGENKSLNSSTSIGEMRKQNSPIKLHKKSSNKTEHDRDSTKLLESETISPPLFSSMKSSKIRTHIKRNSSPSPEAAIAVDLRVNGPPEKQARLQINKQEDKGCLFVKKNLISPNINITASQNKDVDLCQMSTVISKKRHSTESPESSAPKKSKTDIFNGLFGNKDTDLRQLPIVVARAETPPPPSIISLIAEKELEEKRHSPKRPTDLDAVRAKLAMATNNADKVFSKSSHKDHLSLEKCIEGKLSNEQGQEMLSKIFVQTENQELIVAQKKDKEDSTLMNMSLQSISDDELLTSDCEDVSKPPPHLDKKCDKKDDSHYNKNETSKENTMSASCIYMIGNQPTGDKDERILPIQVPYDEMYRNKFSRLPRKRRHVQNGRANHRRMWEGPNSQHERKPLQQRMNPVENWRPLDRNLLQRNSPGNFSQTEYPNNGNLHPIKNNGKKSPEVEDLVVESVHQDNNKTICIDGIPREIRCYDDTAVIFINWDDPRDISFQDGNRRVIFGENEIYLLYFKDPPKDVMINGSLHKVKLGTPTREIIIDGKPYECYFGGPGIVIDLDGQPTSVKLEGPPPQVNIGSVKRTDLVLGKINLIIDEKIVTPVFLDFKLQKFIFNGDSHTLKFVDGLKSVLIDDVNMEVEYGGLPKPIMFYDKKYFIRFTVLPRGVQPGNVLIQGMEGCQPEFNSIIDKCSQVTNPILDTNEPALPVMTISKSSKHEDSPDTNCNSENLLHNPIGNLHVLSSHLMSSMAPTPSVSTSEHSVENMLPNSGSQSPADNSQKQEIPLNVNINELFQKLVETGIVTANKTNNTIPSQAAATSPKDEINKIDNTIPSTSQPSAVSSKYEMKPEIDLKPSTRRSAIESLKPISFDKPETLKIRQTAIYDIILTGVQCSSCGLRFPAEQSMQYSRHLDWHFRQNRKEKRNIRVGASRHWYYSFENFKKYEEIEDLEEREKNYFDQQQEEYEEEVQIPSAPALPEIAYSRCEVCTDVFEQFFHEEKEEWHLRNAIRINEKTYHPLCYEDNLKKPNTTPEPQDNNDDGGEDDDVIINEVVPEKIIINDDEDDYSYQIEESSKLRQPKVHKVKQIDDGFMDVEEALPTLKSGNLITVKTKPVDLSDDVPAQMEDAEVIPVSTSEHPIEEMPEEIIQPAVSPSLIRSGIDGNVELDSARSPTAGINGKIKINISKPITLILPKASPRDETVSESENLENILIDPSQPLPPGEEPIQLNLKPALRGIELTEMPPVRKGSELTGMCSIM